MKQTQLYEKEHIEILGNDIGVIVSNEHTFGTDAMLLASFASPKKSDIACDLGTGCGIIPLLWVRDKKCSEIYAVEIQKQGFNQLERSIKANSLEKKLFAVNSDLRKLKGKVEFGRFDLVTMNPPYKKENAGIVSEKQNEQIARHETACNFEDICLTASKLLKFGGRFAICIRPERCFEMMQTMAQFKLEPKRLRLVKSRADEKPWLCLIESRLGGKSGLTVEKDFVLYKDGESYTDEMNSILYLYRKD